MRSVQSGFPMSLWVAGPFIKLSDFVSYVNLTNFVRLNLFMRWAADLLLMSMTDARTEAFKASRPRCGSHGVAICKFFTPVG